MPNKDVRKNNKMKIEEKYGNLFENNHLISKHCCYVHCISADFALGAGIAKEFQKQFNIRDKLKAQCSSPTDPTCIRIDNVYNLVTKRRCWDKPTYATLRQALKSLKNQCLLDNITTLYMPKIGCGLDRLAWSRVKVMLIETFKDTEIKIEVYFI